MPFAPKQFFDDLLNARHASLSADQHHFVDLAVVDTGVFHALLRRPHRPLQNIFDHGFELRPGQLLHQVLRPGSVRRNKRQIDLSLHGGRKLDLRALRRIPQTLQSHLVALAAQVETFILLELVNQPIHQPLIDVVAAQMRVAVSGLHFDHAFAHFQHRDVKSPAAEVVHRDRLVLTLVEPVSQRSRRRLVDDSLNVQPRDPPRIFSSLPLRIVKVSRHSNDRLSDLLTQIVFRRLLQLLQNHRRDLRRGILLPLRHDHHVVPIPLDLVRDHLQFFADLVIAPPHKPLDRVNRILRIGNSLPLSDLPHQPFAGLGESNDRRSSAATLFVRYNLRLPTLHNRHAGVGGTQVNSNSLAHIASSK